MTDCYVIFRDESATYFISLCQQILMVDFKNIKIFRNAVGHTVCFLRNKKCRSFIFCISNALGAHVVSRIGCFWEILIAGCCRGLTGFNKLVLSTHNAVTTPYIDLSSIIHTVRFVSYSRFWISLFGVNTEFTIWQLNFVYIYTPPSKIKIKNYDTWPTLHVSKLKTKPQCICILTAQLHTFCALKVRQCAFFPQDYSYLSVLANENHLPTLFKHQR